jgi:hypothetical protein
LKSSISAITLSNQVNSTPAILGTSAFKEIYDSIAIITEQHGLLESLFCELEPLLEEE